MKSGRLMALILLAAAPAMAQPIIVPLETQPKPVAPPAASAPPVAPPTAAPSQPDTAATRGEPAPQNSTQQEGAVQPPRQN